MRIRHAVQADLAQLAAIEAASYPSAEGASEESIRRRIARFPECFWLLENENGEIAAFINGMRTDARDLDDAMYDDPSLHNPQGQWLMLFSVVTAPGHRKKGYASRVMRQVIQDTQACTGIVLTCKEALLPFYARFGFQNEGISQSTHGDTQWYQMRLIFP